MSFIENNSGGIIYMTASNIDTVHAFTTRFGGVSKGIYTSLNLGEHCGDINENVTANYMKMCDALNLPFENMVFSRQVHKSEVRTVSYDDRHRLFSPIGYEADGIITNLPELPLVIFTADCIPVLLHDPVSNAIGAVHCGWRGTVLDIIGKAVQKMQVEFGCNPSNIKAAIGPGISLCCFETGSEVADAVQLILGCEADRFVFPKGKKFMVDLKGINKYLLEKSGVLTENISVSDECTMCSHDKYWSHRYTNGKRGSQASIIMLKGSAK